MYNVINPVDIALLITLTTYIEICHLRVTPLYYICNKLSNSPTKSKEFTFHTKDKNICKYICKHKMEMKY